ncbi:hypothetical protein CRYUN_Cryun05aG0272800 [Craigia yunnanensis]
MALVLMGQLKYGQRSHLGRLWNFIELPLSSPLKSPFPLQSAAGKYCDQRQLLLGLKNSLNSISLGKLVNWNQTTDCCSWDEASYDAGGRVIGLDLSNQLISGAIDNSNSLFRLQHLQRLNLAHNRLIFDFPSGFDKFANVSYLNLSNAGFKGQIPAEISRMTRLVTLDLSASLLLGKSLKLEMPNLEMLVRNLTRLRFLHLDGVNISARGNEWCQTLSSLTNLQVLSLSSCNLSGPIDSSFSKLRSSAWTATNCLLHFQNSLQNSEI